MPKRQLTEEQRQRARDNLARGRETRAANKAAAAEATAEPDPSDDVPETPIQPIADDRRERLLQGIDPAIASLISDDELDVIEREEQERAAADRKKQALADVRSQMRQRARVENDLISADVLRSDDEKRRLAELVRFKITLPREGAGGRGAYGFRVDGRLYQQGAIYTESRAVFESLQSNFYGAWKSEYQFKTLDQHKPGQSATESLGNTIPRFEVV